MSDHLPECKALDPMPEATRMFYSTSRQWFWEHGCICDRLRACEQRVLGDRDEIVGITAVRSFRAGLDTASEAISGLFFLGWAIDRRQALAAIDALKGKP